MSLKVEDLIRKINVKTKDFNNQKYTVDEKIEAINDAFTKHISGDVLSFAKSIKIPLVEGEYVYKLPSDFIEEKVMYIETFNKRKIYIKHLEDTEVDYFSLQNIRRGYSESTIGIYKDRVSHNEYEIMPSINADRIKPSTITHRGNVPDEATINDVWVSNEGVISKCMNTYAPENAQVTIYPPSRPASSLTFSSKNTGTQYISIEIVRAGETGTSSYVMSGLGTYSDPYKYVFNMFDNDNSNDAIITMLSTDTHLLAFGSSATTGTVEAIGETLLINGALAFWENMTVEWFYKATFPGFNSIDDELPDEIHPLLADGNAISSLASAELYKDRSPQEVQAFMSFGLDIVEEAKYHIKKSRLPKKMRLKRKYLQS